jgi:folate-binding protein YgfZ
MDKMNTDIPKDYEAALQGAAYFPQPQAGCLHLTGDDRLDFLQRQTSNDLRQLTEARSALTVLVSPTARILDVLRVLPQGELLMALTLPGHAAATLSYLGRRIFFMDKVALADASAEVWQVDLEGPGASQALVRLGFQSAPLLNEVARLDLQRGGLVAIGQRGLAGLGFRLLGEASVRGELEDGLAAAGAVVLSPDSQHLLRVEAGLPAAGAELSEDYTPLEAGMELAVSGDKGCYPGQEVLARQVTYDKVTQRLVGLKLSQPVTPGRRLLAVGKPAGVITSAAVSPRFGAIALGVVKRPHHEVGTRLELETKGNAEVVALPQGG